MAEPVDPGDLEACLRVLEQLRRVDIEDPVFAEVERAAAHLRKAGQKKRKLARRQQAAAHDAEILGRTQTFMQPVAPRANAAIGSEAELLRRRRLCYVCDEPYRLADRHYHALCPSCADRNAERRSARADLSGRRAIVTGGRIKIGFHTALKLLRDGAAVDITTRFPNDADRRYTALPDSSDWLARLRIHEVDFLSGTSVDGLFESLGDRPVDILINNAAQTIRRPPA